MSVYQDAAEFVQREAERAASLAKVAEALRGVGSLEQAAGEAQAKLDGLNKQIAAAQVSIDEAKVYAAKIAADGQAAADAAKAAIEAERTKRLADVVAAESGVQNAKAEASAAAEKMLGIARDQAQVLLAEAKAEADGYGGKIALAEQRLADIAEQHSGVQAKLDAANAQLSELRAKL